MKRRMASVRGAVWLVIGLMLVPFLSSGQELVRSIQMSDEEASSLAREGSKAYEQGDFDEAEVAYRRLVLAGRDSAEAYYNLGNSLYRLGRTGEAILAWEKARRLQPGDESIRFNLTFAQGRITDRVEEAAAEANPLRALGEWHGRISAMAATGVFIIAWWAFHACLAGSLFLGGQRLRRTAAYLLPMVLLAVLVSGAVLGGVVYRTDVVVEAVIMPPRVDLVSGPGEGAVRLTTVHEGLKVRLRGQRGEWVEVLLPNGVRGWLPAAAVAAI